MKGMNSSGSWLRLAALGALLAGCTAQPRTTLPDPAVLAAHESEHGPPWGPEELPWVAPPVGFYDPYPWYAGGPTIGLGLGVRRGGWWGGGYRGGYRSSFIGRGGFRGGFHGRGGGGRGRR
jgi:hypothetical protein